MMSLLLSVTIANALDTADIKNMPSDKIIKKLTDPNQKSVELLLSELWSRSDAGQADAMFWRGWYQFQWCNEGGKIGLKNLDAAPACVDAFELVKRVAENEKIKILWFTTAAMDLVGEMYEKGIGVRKSKYVAADWYIKAAKQKNQNQQREGALNSMEKALDLVPDHPGALTLRGDLTK